MPGTELNWNTQAVCVLYEDESSSKCKTRTVEDGFKASEIMFSLRFHQNDNKDLEER